ncbi:MAG: peptidase A2A, partial [Woeseiaceae bacterium]
MPILALPLALLLASEPAAETPVPPIQIPLPTEPPPVFLEELAVTAPEPRFVAPTRRDKIGRIWAPVLINGQGPFRLVLDTGA